jgi:signal transduction histidine kinase/DNA-binding response OmpR family regulator
MTLRLSIFKNYSGYNGLQPGAFMPRSGTITPDGFLFFGGQEGFNFFNPASLTTNKNIPPVVITELKIDNKIATPSEKGSITQSILLAKEINLKYKQAFSISFAALDFTVPEANQYQYKLEGFDKDWIRPGKDHNAYYGNLPPGSYVFKVKASNNDGIWNEEGRSVKIMVAPPFYRTNLAYIIYALAIIGALLYSRKLGIKRIQMRMALEQERKNAKEILERERREAEYLHNLDHMKIKFLTNLSHEFKTPISLIVGPVENLMREINDKAPLNQLNLIKRNTKRLLNLVNQLLDFRKLEEGELNLQASEGDIVPFLKEVCDFFTDLAERKKIEFGFSSQIPSLPLLFDHNKMERILFNLLSNAFKFTPEGGNIAVNLEQNMIEEEGIAQITVSVKDSGIGIPKELHDRIFESFFQHNAGTEILNQGTGIGLAIAREFVNLHNGKVWVNSEPGKGSTFSFSLKLPLAISTGRDAAFDTVLKQEPTKEQELYQNSTQPAILIVEDDDDFRFYLKDGLNANYRIFEATNGHEAWHRILFHHPDILVCDIHMPVMNGLELVQKIKADKRTKHIPVILLTAATPPNGLLDGLEIGAIDYMTKPFDFAVLQAKINSILLLNQSFKDTYSKQVTLSLPETEVVSEKDRFIQKALAYIYENIDNPQLSVEILSSHMNISRASLYNKLFEYTGVSPIEFIRSVKLDKAIDLLEKTDKNISEIAYESGFANPNYFTKVFKSKYKVTPTEYLAAKKAKD